MQEIAPSTRGAKRRPSRPDFVAISPWVERALTLLLPQKHLALINVNVPAEPQGVCWTRQAIQHYDGRVVPAKDPMGRQHYWYTVVPIEEAAEGTDRWAMARGYVSVTPLRLDLTDHERLRQERGRLGCQDDGVVVKAPAAAAG